MEGESASASASDCDSDEESSKDASSVDCATMGDGGTTGMAMKAQQPRTSRKRKATTAVLQLPQHDTLELPCKEMWPDPLLRSMLGDLGIFSRS